MENIREQKTRPISQVLGEYQPAIDDLYSALSRAGYHTIEAARVALEGWLDDPDGDTPERERVASLISSIDLLFGDIEREIWGLRPDPCMTSVRVTASPSDRCLEASLTYRASGYMDR